MTNLSSWFYKISSGRLAILLIVIFVLFMIFVLPDQAAKADEYAEGAGSPDTSFYYSSEELFDLAEVYGEEGRAAYVRARFTFDLIFPAVYGVFLLVTVSWVFGRALPVESKWRLINLVPLAGVLFDLLENISTSVVMAGYPVRREFAAMLAPVLTLIKWIFVNGSFVILVIGLLMLGYIRLTQKK